MKLQKLDSFREFKGILNVWVHICNNQHTSLDRMLSAYIECILSFAQLDSFNEFKGMQVSTQSLDRMLLVYKHILSFTLIFYKLKSRWSFMYEY